MNKNKQIKVNLVRHNSGIGATEYELSKIVGAVVVHSYLKDLRAGNRLSEKEAEQLSESYQVTVVPSRS